MSEEKDADVKSADVVKKEDYNKVVESHNSLKSEKEKLEKELSELKEVQKKVEEKKEEEDKLAWEKEKEEKDKIIADLKAKVEDNTVVKKGVVKEPTSTEATSDEKIKEQLDKHIPEADTDPKKFASNIQRYGHYKSPTTKQYTEDQFGKGLSLDAGAQITNPSLINRFANKSKEDIILK